MCGIIFEIVSPPETQLGYLAPIQLIGINYAGID